MKLLINAALATVWVFCLVFSVYGVLNFGIIAVFLVLPLCFLAHIKLNSLSLKLHEVEEMKAYGNYIENIYIFSDYEDDNTVLERANTERHKLTRSGNKLDVTVHEIYFRDAGYTNESFEDFRIRVAEFIKEDREKRHKWLNSQGRVFFIKNVLGQK